MSKGFFVTKDDGAPVFYGTRSDKPGLEAAHNWVPSDDARAAALHEAMRPAPPPAVLGAEDVAALLVEQGVLTQGAVDAKRASK